MNDFETKFNRIWNALVQAGYDPYAQLYGYAITGDRTFITRADNARELVLELDISEIVRKLRKIQH